MTSTIENLASTLVSIEASSSRLVKSMSEVIEDWLELKSQLEMAKTILEEGFADLERREKRFQSIHAFRESAITRENSVESRQHEVEKELRAVKSKMVAMTSEFERLQQRMSSKTLNPVRISHEVGEASNLMSIVPFKIGDEPKKTTLTFGERTRKLKSELWNYFTKMVEENGKRCKCNYCSKEYSCRSTRNMRDHITMGKCHAYEDQNAANKRVIVDVSNSSSSSEEEEEDDDDDERAQMMQAKKLRAEVAAGKRVVPIGNGFSNPNDIKNVKMLDFPPPGFPLNQKHKLILGANKVPRA